MSRARWIRALLALVLLVMIAAFTSLLPSRMPSYQGRTLRQWLDALPNVPNDSLFREDSPPGSAQDALRHLGPTAVPFLIKMVNARDGAFSDKLKTFLDRQDLVRLPYHHAGDEQIEALKGLSALGPAAKPAIPSVMMLIQEGQNHPSRSLFTLAKIGPDAIPALIQLLQNTNRIIRSGAATYLGNFRDHGQIVVPALIPCLDDPDEQFRDSVAIALWGFGHEAHQAVPKLLQLAHNKDYDLSAVNALMTIDYGGSLRTLTNELRSADAQLRAKAASILGWFKDRGRLAVPALVECLKDKDEHVRAAAVIALGRIGEEPDLVAPALLENLNGGDLMSRTWTAIALGSFGDRGEWRLDSA